MGKYLFLIFFIFVFLEGVYGAPPELNGSHGQNKLEQLEAEIFHLAKEVNGLSKTVETLEAKMTTNLADQYADKTIQSVLSNNQNDAKKFWLQMLNHAKQVQPANNLLSKIVQRSYLGTRKNFYPLLEFILKNNISSAFPLLYTELETHGHLIGGPEIFVLANYLKATCGPNTGLFRSLPRVVQNIVSGPVMFQNVENKGYMVASEHKDCKDKTECYDNPKNEALLHRFFTRTNPPAELLQNPRSHWLFLPPITMDMKKGFNGTRMSWGFHIKSVPEDRYLITKMRLTSFFLRDNTSFDSYYVRDLQCQYMPTLIDLDTNDNKIMIGLREKHIYKVEYVYGYKFYKSEKVTQLQTRKSENLLGNVWEVFPVGGGVNELDSELEDESVSDSKCQF